MSVSSKNKPVVDRLFLLLSQSEFVADAILDNALEEGKKLDSQIIADLNLYLVRIADILNAAEEPN
tara:strand:- start:271 stop:468 length:198 start_codon:yes stop_codon:yes gene_type:complete